MKKTIDAYHDMIITFPENVNNYTVLRLNFKTNKRWFRKRKTFFLRVFDNNAEALKFRESVDSESCSLNDSYLSDVKYDEERVIYIFNTNDTPIDINMSLRCYSDEEYKNRNKYEHVTATSGI